ncbi:MAG: T9SS type A sorting domain-containing protein [Bacteroidetes bacterium]|nr:T9SS type A sorting domain-containing protein [Bacteroidota bacterium]
MEKFSYMLIMSSIWLSSGLLAQNCPIGDITFTNQSQVDNFPVAYPGCTQPQGSITISGGNHIVNLLGLLQVTSIGGSLTIKGNNILTNLSGLNYLTSVGGDLTLGLYSDGANHSLNDISALVNLTHIGGSLLVEYEDALHNLSALSNLTTLGQGLVIRDNPVLNCICGLNGVTSTGSNFYLTNNPALPDLQGLDHLTSIGGDVNIKGNHSLTSFTGLGNLTSIHGTLWIDSDTSLVSLNGLNGLGSIGGYLSITYNPALADISALQNLTVINWNIIGGFIDIYDNDHLASLSGLDNINSNAIHEVYLIGNASLSKCAVNSICGFLPGPWSSTTIENNASGCNSIHQVMDSCTLLSVRVTPGDNGFCIFPNPVTDKISVEIPGEISKGVISLFNIQGQEVVRQTLSATSTQLDVSNLKSGIYFVRIISEKRAEVIKIIKR